MDLPVNYENLSPKERRVVRDIYVYRQGGLCQYCGRPLTGQPRRDIRNMKVNPKLYPPTFFNWPVHLHHDHKTGMTIGAVHAYCNAVAWEYDGE